MVLGHMCLEQGLYRRARGLMMYRHGDEWKNSSVIMAFKGRPATKRKRRNLNCFVSLELEPGLE